MPNPYDKNYNLKHQFTASSNPNFDFHKVKNVIARKNLSGGTSIRDYDLEEKLNDLIYKDAKKEIYATTINGISDAYIDYILNNIVNTSISAILSNSKESAEREYNRNDGRGRASLANEVVNVKNKIIKSIENLTARRGGETNWDFIEGKLNQILNYTDEAMAVIEELQAYYGYRGQGKSDRYFLTNKNSKKDFVTLKTILYALDAFDDLIHTLPNGYELGTKFENVTTDAINDLTQKESTNLFGEIVRAFRTGDNIVSRNAMTKTDNMATIKLDKIILDTYKKDFNLKNNTTGYVVSGDGYSIKYTPTHESKSKVDVQIDTPKGNKSNLSLKNWKNFESNKEFGLGKTTVLSALVRSSNNAMASKYGLVMLQDGIYNNDRLAQAHEFAKLCLAADILMGISQKNNFANKLVINNREKSHIFVYNIKNLILGLDNNLSNLIEFSGYDKTPGPTPISILGSISSRRDRTGKYLSQELAILHSKMIDLKFSNNFFNNPENTKIT